MVIQIKKNKKGESEALKNLVIVVDLILSFFASYALYLKDFFFWGFFFGLISVFLSYISKAVAVGSIVVYALATFVIYVEIGFGYALISFILLVLCGIAAYHSK